MRVPVPKPKTLTNLRKAWAVTLKKAGLPHFALYEVRHTFATRLSAGGVADHVVTQMLRQGHAEVFKLYSQAKLGMMREALAKLDRQVKRTSGLGVLTRSGPIDRVFARFSYGRRKSRRSPKGGNAAIKGLS